MAQTEPAAPFSIAERLMVGNLTVNEVCCLAGVSRAKFYDDRKRGLVSLRKRGRASVVEGPEAARYIRGEAPTSVS